MARVDVEPVSRPPELDPDAPEDDRVELMVVWFRENFEDPANQLPYESASGGYQWLWGGPYDAIEELEAAFPDAPERELKAAVEAVEAAGTLEWSANSRRIVSQRAAARNGGGWEARAIPESVDRHRSTIVETTLFPRRDFGWSLHVTFVPVGTNTGLDEVAAAGMEVGRFGREDREFDSLRHLVLTLLGDELVGSAVGDRPDAEEAYAWLQSLESDAEVFVDDGVVVHASPPEWLQLRGLFEHGACGGVALLSQSPGHYSGVVLMYGGSILFLRLVKNVNYLQDAFFERWAKRIRGGRFKP